MAQNVMAATSALPQLVKTQTFLRQALFVTGAPTSGTFTVTVAIGSNSAQTAGLAYNITAAALQTAITGLANVGAGNATVTGSGTAADPFVVVFAQSLAAAGVSTLYITTSFGGGNNPSVVVLGAGDQTFYTVPASTTLKVARLSVVNTGTIGSTCGVSVVPAGQSAARIVPAVFAVGANDSLPDAAAGMFLGPGDALVITPGASSFDVALSGVVLS